ncbi:MAG TPA: ASCH domain-containing protein, partial [Desulfurivibrionaceae bacterium]|nr:ASCH domain-containing protein [Desulfurivibrionaceae bacterium]
SWQKVLSGQKTQTRRLARDSDRLWSIEHEGREAEKVLWRGEKAKWRTGRSYAVQPGRGKKAIARIRLLDIQYQLLGHVSEEEANAEGYASLAEFIQTWTKIHGHYDLGQPVWALEFRLIPERGRA